jgi:hypothetical protein
MRITARRRVGRLTSAKPAAAKMLAWPTCSSPPGDVLSVLGDHGIALQGTSSALAREGHRGACKRVADAAATEP